MSIAVRSAFTFFSFSALLVLPVFAQSARIDFAQDVHPILATKCFACHGGDKRSGGLSLQEYSDVLKGGRSGAAIIPGDSKSSLLMLRVTGVNAPQMPLAGPKLTEQEVATIRTWIDEGARPAPNAAAAKRPWTPQMALTAPDVPASPWANWSRPGDKFLAAYFAEHGVAEPQVVSDAVFARRAYLDIWGLVPPPEQLEAFVSDQSPDKRDKLVEKLLAEDKNYAENWASFWNDLLRNDEGVNYQGARKSITPWLTHALETNMPYNQFVATLMNPAGPGDPDGFLIGVNWRGDVSASQTPAMQAAQNSAQVFLGVNLKCNSCHDSFISRWKLKDAYGLAAYFSPNEKLELYRCDKPNGQYATAKFLYPELDKTGAVPVSLAERHAAAAKMFTEPENGRLPRTLVNRVWQRLIGRGIVENVDDMDAEPWNPALLDWLSADFVAHNYDMKHLIATIMESRAYQMPVVKMDGEKPKEYVFRGPEVRRLTAEEFVDSLSEITGEWRVVIPSGAKEAVYVREWRAGSSSLTRALGRPIRDQVFTERNNEATMLQGLEMVNGETLTHMLNRGAERMLGELKPAPVALYDSGELHRGDHSFTSFDIDISQVKELRLLVSDRGSYAPERVLADWAQVELVSANGATPLSSLKPEKATGLRAGSDPIELQKQTFTDGLRSTSDSMVVYDLAGKGFTRLRGTVGIEKKCMQDDISPATRFFVFDRQPDMEHLVEVASAMPTPAPKGPFTKDQLVNRIFVQALGRTPTPAERKLALAALEDPNKPDSPSASGLADLLWSVSMLPEFQMIH